MSLFYPKIRHFKKTSLYDITNSSIENMQAVVRQSRHSSVTSLISSRNGSISIHSGGRISTGNNENGWQDMSGSFKSSKNEIRTGSLVNSGGLERGGLERGGLERNSGPFTHSEYPGNSGNFNNINSANRRSSKSTFYSGTCISSTGNIQHIFENQMSRRSIYPKNGMRPPMLRQNTWDETNMRKIAQKTAITGYGRAVKRDISSVKLMASNTGRSRDKFRDEGEKKEDELANMIPGLKL